MAQRRFNTLLPILFAGLAVILAVVGIYPVAAYAVNQRTFTSGTGNAEHGSNHTVCDRMLRLLLASVRTGA